VKRASRHGEDISASTLNTGGVVGILHGEVPAEIGVTVAVQSQLPVGSYISPLSRVPLRYLTVDLTAWAWEALGSEENQTH
jgi:hypothetical protein